MTNGFTVDNDRNIKYTVTFETPGDFDDIVTYFIEQLFAFGFVENPDIVYEFPKKEE
jgi:hypothetical protein